MVSFACKVTGSPPPVVTWLKNNSTQPNATQLEIDGISWLILVLVAKQNSEDRYIYAARNSEGEAYLPQKQWRSLQFQVRTIVYWLLQRYVYP